MIKTFTYFDFLKRFTDEDACLEELRKQMYPRGIYCKQCKRKRKFYHIQGRRAYACVKCRWHTHILAGTIYDSSKIPLQKWLFAMYLMIQTRSGVPAMELTRQLGVTYKTAWRMGHKIREVMGEEPVEKLSGIVEIDETYVGGNFWENFRKHQMYGYEDKKVVMGMVERKGRAILKFLPNGAGRRSLFEQIEKYVSKDAHIMTDQLRAYTNLGKQGYEHDSVLHKREFVRGDVYTQNVENVWSHLKRGITGVYRSVSKQHMQKYADEYAFRYSHRNEGPRMFNVLFERISSKA